MEGLRPHAEALDIPEVEREERLYQVSSNYTPKVLCLQLFHFFDFHPQLARQLVGAELQQIVYRLLVFIMFITITACNGTSTGVSFVDLPHILAEAAKYVI